MAAAREEKQSQLQRLADFHARHADTAPQWLAKLEQAVIENGNVFSRAPASRRERRRC